MVALREQVRRLLATSSTSRRPVPVLVQGETGTGKGLLARVMHRAGPRSAAPFVDVNCAAIPDTLLEAELFGYQRGAFTDARESKPGLFQVAHGGTLFLDEIGLLPLPLQAKLLSVLEERKVRRLGSTRSEPADVWIIGATNEDLAHAVREGHFREDLYHRIAVVTLELPPLRRRGSDVIALAEYYLTRTCRDYGVVEKKLTDDARAAVSAHPWPGNVRQLANAIERAALLCEGAEISVEDLGLTAIASRAHAEAPAMAASSSTGSSQDVIREHLHAVLVETGWNVSHTAQRLGVTRNTVRARMARFGLAAMAPARPRALPPSELRAPAAPRTTVVEAPPAPAREAPGRLPTRIRWERRHLTFLKVQLEGARDADLGDRRLLDTAADKIVTFGGRIEGLSPSALFATFGIEPMNEPAVCATHCALAIERAARETSADAAGVASLKLGLHAADIAVGNGAATQLVDLDGASEIWTVLDRAMSEGEQLSLIVTASVAELIRRRFVVVPLAPAATTYRIEGPWRAERGAKVTVGPFVGRREELGLLESRVKAVLQGRGHIVELAGHPGIGKSRLLLELARRLPANTAVWLEGSCQPHAIATPFFPLLPILRAVCGLNEADAPEMIETRVAAACAALGLTRGDVERDLVRLISSQPAPAAGVPPDSLKARLFAAVQQLLRARCARTPLLVVVEDLHWADGMSEACLASMTDVIAAAPILLIVTYRTGYRSPWLGAGNVTQIGLSPLLPEDSITLVRSVIQGDETVRQILSRGEGNPLFLEELARATLERGSLPARVPASVEETIAGRLEGLAAGPRAVLDTAAVIGGEVPDRLLRRVAELGEGTFADAVEQLQRGEFLWEAWMSGVEHGYAFKHALVQEVAYTRLASDRRRILHERVLDALETEYADRLVERVESLAHHAVLGDARPRAVRYLLQAGQKAFARSALAEATMHVERGLGLLAVQPAGLERDGQELAYQSTLAAVLMATKGYAASATERAYVRARELCRVVGDGPGLGPVLAGQWAFYLLKADYASADAMAQDLVALGEREQDPLILAAGHRGLAFNRLYTGHFVEAREAFERALTMYRPEAHDAVAVGGYGGHLHPPALAYLGRTLWCLGHPDLALARGHEAVVQAQTWSPALVIAQALGMVGSLNQLRHDVGATLVSSERALAFAREKGLAYWIAQSTILCSWASAMTAPPSEQTDAIAGIRRSVEQYRATGTILGTSWFLTLLAEVYGVSRQPLEGLRVLDEAELFVDKTGELYHAAEIHRLRGDLLLMQDNDEARKGAEACFRRALEIARGQHARGWALRAATSLARLWSAGERRLEARELLAPVRASFSEGAATRDLRAADAVLAGLV